MKAGLFRAIDTSVRRALHTSKRKYTQPPSGSTTARLTRRNISRPLGTICYKASSPARIGTSRYFKNGLTRLKQALDGAPGARMTDGQQQYYLSDR